MSDNSKIEWTDATWNPVRGCTKISPGCTHCYAETLAERFRGVPGHPFEFGFDLLMIPEKLADPIRWSKPKKIFVNSMSDLFHEDVPDEFIEKVSRALLDTELSSAIPKIGNDLSKYYQRDSCWAKLSQERKCAARCATEETGWGLHAPTLKGI